MTDRLYQLAYRLAFRLLRVWWLVRRPTTSGASVAVWHDGSVLMIRNSYRRRLTLPGGHIGGGENAVAAAVRELREEAGVHVGVADVRPAYARTVVWDRRKDRCEIFEVALPTRPAIRIDNREVVWAAFMSPDDALAANPTPHVRAYLQQRRETGVPRPIDPDPSAT